MGAFITDEQNRPVVERGGLFVCPAWLGVSKRVCFSFSVLGGSSQTNQPTNQYMLFPSQSTLPFIHSLSEIYRSRQVHDRRSQPQTYIHSQPQTYIHIHTYTHTYKSFSTPFCHTMRYINKNTYWYSLNCIPYSAKICYTIARNTANHRQLGEWVTLVTALYAGCHFVMQERQNYTKPIIHTTTAV